MKEKNKFIGKSLLGEAKKKVLTETMQLWKIANL